MKISFRCPPELEATLPRPLPARKQIPNWFGEMPSKTRVEEYNSEIPTIKKCPAFVDVLSSGFYLPLATDIEVDGPEFNWNWGPFESTIGPYPDSPIGNHCPQQLFGTPLIDGESSIVKFHNFLDNTPGKRILAAHNSPDLQFRCAFSNNIRNC